MTTFTLLGQFEKLADEKVVEKSSLSVMHRALLYHQWRTYTALEISPLVVNTYNTGTGKTIASLLHLFRLGEPHEHVLFIAPTNALIEQHANDIRRFVADNGLDFLVAPINAATLRRLDKGKRPGETLYQLLENPLTYYEFFELAADEHRKRPVILVTNPDLFYYALYFQFGGHDRRNIFQKMVTSFAYVVIDEFHYYNSKQFANFLFYFLLLRQFGRLGTDSRMRVCLLSATPTAQVNTFLNRVFGAEWSLVAPTNEPPNAVGLATVATLTPLRVTVTSEDLTEWVGTNGLTLKRWLELGQHGALISSALWRVNDCYARVKPIVGEARLGRITGPEPESARQDATQRDFVLATPTVDIGYNFEKPGKTRQNVDFVLCDSVYRDEAVQRLGRAGRVLGKPHTTISSDALLVVPEDTASAFRGLEGQALERGAFADWIATQSAFPEKHDLGAYIRTHAILECFYPLRHLLTIADGRVADALNDLYATVCDIFAPDTRDSRRRLEAMFHRHEARKNWLKANTTGALPITKETAQMIADWANWQSEGQTSVKAEIQDVLMHLRQSDMAETAADEIRNFVRGQVALTSSLFAFRDSFQEPVAAVYDPQYLLSSDRWNEADLFHILQNYEYETLSEQAWRESGAPVDIEGIVYLKLVRLRDKYERLRITFTLEVNTEMEEATWCKIHCSRVVAVEGIAIHAARQDGSPYPIDRVLAKALSDQWLVALILTPASQGAFRNRMRFSRVFARPLALEFDDASRSSEAGYSIVLGTGAWFAEPELRKHFLYAQRPQLSAIIL